MLNPESQWMDASRAPAFDPKDVESRIGAVSEPLSLLSGGLANTNIRIGKNRVLRIYRRDKGELAKERALLLSEWQFLSVPKILASGHDHLLLSYVEHEPLKGTPEEGEALGLALSEIHGQRYDSAGLLGADLDLREFWPDLLASLSAYLDGCVAKLDVEALGALGHAASAAFKKSLPELKDAIGPPVLLHADFKLSNLHRCPSGPPLVLDWEFAYAGSFLSDIGQLMRWSPPKAFEQGFEAAYQAAELPKDWRRLARLMDLPNLAGLLVNTEPHSIRDRDISVLLREIIR